jgi:hypothetical protein
LVLALLDRARIPARAVFGVALTREVAVHAVTTAGAAAGWIAARLTGRGVRARTVALTALVGTQLGQTLLVGYRSPRYLFDRPQPGTARSPGSL